MPTCLGSCLEFILCWVALNLLLTSARVPLGLLSSDLVVFCIKGDDWLVSRDPKMKPKLGALQAMFPDISMSVLQERLAAAEGHLPNAVKVFFFTYITPCEAQVSDILTSMFKQCAAQLHPLPAGFLHLLSPMCVD